jgi:hypothetical protein
MEIPTVTIQQMSEVVRQYIPSAELKEEVINPDYSSWRLRVVASEVSLEFLWGPLSGFGVTNLSIPLTENDNPFAPYDIGFESLEAAENYLADFVKHGP